MKPVFYSSKEEIRNRILKNAEDFWNIKESNDFDPLIKLIVEVLSNELFNISNDVKNLENRIFDKISRILAPDHLTSALPAHAILHARPTDRDETISKFTQFTFKKLIQQEDERTNHKKTELFFSPINEVKLHHASLQYIATGNTLFQMDDLSKVPLLNTLPGFNLKNDTLYLGLTGVTDLQSLTGLNLFFNWKNYAVPDHTYDLLSLSRWFFEDTAIEIFTDQFMDEVDKEVSTAPFHHKQLINLLKADVLQFYSNRFLTLGDIPVTDGLNRQFPQELLNVFQPAGLNQLKEGTIWIKVEVPAAINQDMLNELYVHINAFPVVNKKLSQIKHRLKTMNSVIPIRTDDLEQMLAVERLIDNKGKNYNEIPFTNENDKGDGSYAIRYGGTERFDTRNAKELVDYLFELLRDEKVAFSAYGPDFLSTALKNLEQNISLIEQKSRAALKTINELPGYIIVKPLDHADIVFLDIWVTQAGEANRINAGSRATLHDNNKIRPDSIYFLTQTKGGRSKLNNANSVQAYKYGLTTADRIVTKADIVNFCKYELGDKIRGVQIAKGLVLDTKPSIGFVKTTDVIVEPSDRLKLSAQEWQELLDLTLAKLKLRSTMNIHYRLLLKPGSNLVYR
jgi:hypothetical protein